MIPRSIYDRVDKLTADRVRNDNVYLPLAGAAAGAVGPCASGLSDTFVQDVACGRQHACCFPGPAQPAQLSGHPGHFGHGCWHR